MKKEYSAPEFDLVKFEFLDETLLRESSEDFAYNVFDDNDETESGYGFSFKPQN